MGLKLDEENDSSSKSKSEFSNSSSSRSEENGREDDEMQENDKYEDEEKMGDGDGEKCGDRDVEKCREDNTDDHKFDKFNLRTIKWMKLILYQQNKIEFTTLSGLHIFHQRRPKTKMFLIIT